MGVSIKSPTKHRATAPRTRNMNRHAGMFLRQCFGKEPLKIPHGQRKNPTRPTETNQRTQILEVILSACPLPTPSQDHGSMECQVVSSQFATMLPRRVSARVRRCFAKNISHLASIILYIWYATDRSIYLNIYVYIYIYLLAELFPYSCPSHSSEGASSEASKTASAMPSVSDSHQAVTAHTAEHSRRAQSGRP